MDSLTITGHIDEQHRLIASVPDSVPAGPVTIRISPVEKQEDDAGDAWMTGITREWAAELADPREDIYCLADGEPIRDA